MIRKELSQYVEATILPQYEAFDPAHDLNHVKTVIGRSQLLAPKVNADLEMVYVVAAYHDIGIKVSRDKHNIYSAQVLKDDICLRSWFSPYQITIMSEAVEDHSKSNGVEPRTIYGKIVSQADVELDMELIVKRSFLYGKTYYPFLSSEEHIERVYEYLIKKYGENGTYHLWINIPSESEKLKQIREVLRDKCFVVEECRKLELAKNF